MPPYECYVCGAVGCRLYRPYGEFFRPTRVRCQAHIPPEESGWFVPLMTAPDGSVWGYTSAPPEAVEAWEAKPEGEPR